MATKMKRFLAIIIALSLCAGHILVPAIAVETEKNVTVEVAVSQAPEASSDMNVATDTNTSFSVNAEGVVENKTSTTTDWSGTNENGQTVTGSETVTNVTGADEQGKLYEGGTIEGSETITGTSTSTETTKQENVLVSDTTETTHGEEDGDVITEIFSSTTTENHEGQWIEGELIEGETKLDQALSGETEDRTAIDIDTTLPGNVTINLTPNDKKGTTVTKTISIEDVISGAITLPAEGNYTELKDENGNVIGYEIVTTTENAETKVTVSDPQKSTGTRIEAAEVTLPEGIQAGSEPIYAEDGTTVIGEVVTDIVPTYDDSGKVVKYVITKTTTVNTDETTVTESDAASSQEAATGTTILLPERPAMSVSTDPVTGIRTTVTVEDILDDNGNVTGYAVTTKTVSADGTAINSVTEKKYGTLVTTDTTTVTDPTTIETIVKSQEVTTEVIEITAQAEIEDTTTVTTRLNEYIETEMTQTDYAYVEIDGKLYFIYTGSMSVTEGEGHGDTSLMNPIQPLKELFKSNGSLDLAAGGSNVVNNTNAPTEGFKYIGYGINPTLNVSKGNSSSDVVQFRLKSADGKEYYAMCIDFNTTIQSGHLYDIQDITSENYYQQAGSLDVDSAEKLRIIALNGYWGTADNTATTDDVGSMDEVKAMLTGYLAEQGKSEAEIKEIVDSLTPGQALTATQAALWKFGNVDGNKTVNENNLIPNGWDEYGYGWNKTKVKNEDYINAQYVYKALLDLANDPDTRLDADEGVEFLDKEDITAGAITVKSKVVSSDKNHVNNDKDETNDVYNTDLSFTLGIEPSKLNGDLIVTVTVGDEEVKKVRLAGADDPLLPLGRIVKNEDGSYTIPDVEVAEGVSINLNLSGTQDLGTGVYIYTSLDGSFNDSQTLITLATGERKVNLDMNMNFAVEEPTAEATKVAGTKTEGTKKVSTRTDTKTDRASTTRTDTKTAYELDYESNGTVQTKVYTDVTVTKVTTEETREERSWFGSWMDVFEREPEEPTVPSEPEEPTEPSEPDEPTKPNHPHKPQDDDFPINEPELEIPDEEVPLADVPKTGDISLIWAILSGLSAGGLVLLNRKKEN